MEAMPTGAAAERNQVDRPEDPIQLSSTARAANTGPMAFGASEFMLHVSGTLIPARLFQRTANV
jgi:hypothetical protein